MIFLVLSTIPLKKKLVVKKKNMTKLTKFIATTNEPTRNSFTFILLQCLSLTFCRCVKMTVDLQEEKVPQSFFDSDKNYLKC